ncbi:MAG: hypothetical protein LBR84_06585 [Tannerella sp.]|jgi:hypothetical protein|nr:hypothetical protein [Tannerella sp.]
MELYQWITDPSLLSKASLVELRQMVDDYPYFHAVRILYLKNLAMLNDVRLDRELKRMAVHVPDRRRLYMLINDRTPMKKTEPPVVVRTVETTEPVAPAPSKPAATKFLTQPADYIGWLEQNVADLPVGDGKENRLKHQELIDSYLEDENKQLRRFINIPSEEKNDEKVEESVKKTEEIVLEQPSLDDSYFTETLAHVYIKQKRFDKALEIIKVLSLKYPEKNIYFADQIRYLERVININK